MNDKKENKCGCGRSPSGKCIGWHALSEEKYKENVLVIWKGFQMNNENKMTNK